MKTFNLPNAQIVEIYTLKEIASMIKDHKADLESGLIDADYCSEENGDAVDVMYKDGKLYSDDEFCRQCNIKTTNISSAELLNPNTIAVYGNFKLYDMDTCEEYTVEEAMKREDDACYKAVLY